MSPHAPMSEQLRIATDARSRNGVPWRLIFAIPLIAAIVHVIATLLAASNTSNSAFTRLSKLYPLNEMVRLPPISPGQQPLAFLGADATYAVCVFDSRNGPVSINGVLPDLGWTVGVFRADGSNSYFATAAPGRPTRIGLKIITDAHRFLGVTPQALGDPAARDPDVTVEAERGFVLFRAPDRGPSYVSEAERFLSQARCSSSHY